MSARYFSPDAFESGAVSHPMIGRKVGRFRITAKLGAGGVATVWKAQDELLGRTVALKILDDSVSDSPKARRRFAHDAQAAALLDHPGIVTVYDFGECEELVYIALSLVEGETLSDRAARSLMPIAEAVRVASAAADALAHAHDRGVVHRDVTGRNIMIARDGRVIVLDFGLALAVGLSRLTSSSTAMGTAAYIAPEMVTGSEGDARTDLYGLGVVLYEALTGAYPFTGDRPETVVIAALHQAPRPPRELRPEISPALERVVLRAIARKPEDRYPDARVFATDLRGLQAGDSLAEPMVSDAQEQGSTPGEDLGGTGARESARPDPLYLAVLPFQILETASSPEDSLAPLAHRLSVTVSAALARRPGVRVIEVPDELEVLESGSARMLARSLGANALLRGTVSRSGSQARITYSILDPWRSVQFAGDVVDGSVLQPFDLEDLVVESVRRVLELTTERTDTGVTRPPDPAGPERFAQALGYLRRYDNEASVDGALTILDRLVANGEGSASVYAALVRACLYKYRLNRHRVWETRAAAACERARLLAPDAPDTHVALGELHLSAGRIPDAISDFEAALRSQPGSYEAGVGRARALAAAHRVAEAEAAFHEIILRHPDDWRAYSSIGVFHFQRGAFELALEKWQRAVELTPDNAMAHRNLGSAYYRLDRFEEATAAYQESLRTRPNDIAYTNLGTVLYFLHRFDEAIEAFEKATALTPTNALWWGNLGNACLWIPGQESKARRALDHAIELMRDRLSRSEGDGDSLARLAGWLASRGELPEALTYIARAVELAPEEAFVAMRAGHVYFEAGQKDEALRWLEQAVRLGSGRRELRSSPEFESLRDDPEFRRITE